MLNIQLIQTIVVAVVLFYAAIEDMRNFRIPNEITMILVALFFTFSLPTSGVWPTFWHVIFASAIFVVILGVYSLGALGGGDVKLLSAAFLWMGAENASLFCILLAAAATAYLIIYRAFRILPIKLNAKGGIMVPYGPCIAAAWIGTEILQMHP